jgi:FkbM family methyltransferase
VQRIIEESGGVLRTESVPVQRFDEFLHRFRVDHPVKNIFLKLDTQGWDLEVIKGAGDVLVDVRALQSEVSLLPL